MPPPMSSWERLESFYATVELLDANLRRTRMLIDWSKRARDEARRRVDRTGMRAAPVHSPG
jgi:hypothetical protein